MGREVEERGRELADSGRLPEAERPAMGARLLPNASASLGDPIAVPGMYSTLSFMYSTLSFVSVHSTLSFLFMYSTLSFESEMPLGRMPADCAREPPADLGR
jgi:hypothetical protein